MLYRLPFKHFTNRRLIFLLPLLIILILSVYFIHFHKTVSTLPNTNHALSQKVQATVPVSPQTTTQPTADSQKSPTAMSGGTSGAQLIAPYGSFVSNHHPHSGDQEESLCTSTPGASCYIQFTNGSTVKKLDPETIGSAGSVAWAWQVGSLTSGTWKVTAVASLNGQSKSTDDQISLEIQ